MGSGRWEVAEVQRILNHEAGWSFRYRGSVQTINDAVARSPGYDHSHGPIHGPVRDPVHFFDPAPISLDPSSPYLDPCLDPHLCHVLYLSSAEVTANDWATGASDVLLNEDVNNESHDDSLRRILDYIRQSVCDCRPPPYIVEWLPGRFFHQSCLHRGAFGASCCGLPLHYWTIVHCSSVRRIASCEK